MSAGALSLHPFFPDTHFRFSIEHSVLITDLDYYLVNLWCFWMVTGIPR